MIIVIDGPAGSGKSSTAKTIANRLGIQFLDSGALYRAITYLWLKGGKPDKAEFFENLPKVQLQTEYRDQTFFVQADGEDLTDQIRTQHVADHVSEIASYKEARSFVNRYMRNLVTEGAYIADGRDLGTAVFPDADLKFYMDASLEERANRRFLEMRETDQSVSLEDVMKNLRSRDQKDQSRENDPLKKANDAVVIDTTGKSFDEQVSEMIQVIKGKTTLN
ncbi:(d)CMP kinase [Rhodohalobacter halophilus]|uniref:(d)CMP kinase n=1 Tax=Rhodohalobacter halophilus TaxID=1812810 RepID=UPI00083F6633|nr:(d)CMP kinase [Rhodohalobacter halophilus]